jgi:hypothetical protein
MMNYKETLKEIRAEARKVGLTFKTQNARINGAQGWKFVDRRTGEAVFTNLTMNSAYNNVCSGYIATYNKNKKSFDGAYDHRSQIKLYM